MFETPQDHSAQAEDSAQQYCLHVDFVIHNLRRFGVRESSLEDAAQDVFLVAHRRRADFSGRSSMKTWLFGISLKVAQGYRRSLRRDRKYLYDAPATSIYELASSELDGPLELTARREAVTLLDGLLETMGAPKRTLWVLVELEEMSVSAAAKSQGINPNTAYSRLRAAWLAFERALAPHRSGAPFAL